MKICSILAFSAVLAFVRNGSWSGVVGTGQSIRREGSKS
jgi:hypothetical protein